MLSDIEDSLANFFEQYFLETGYLPTKDFLVAECGVTESLYDKCLKNKSFIATLEARGLSVTELLPKDPNDPSKGRFNGKGLTERQLMAANVMLDLEDNRSQKKKLTDVSVSSGEWNAWLRDPAFQGYLRKRAEARLGDSLHEAHLSLLDRVKSGDIAAIKYFNEITGRFVPASNSSTTSVDVKLIINKLLESVMKHVSNPTEQAAIADDLMAMAAAIAVGNSLSIAPPVPSTSLMLEL